MLFRVVFSRFIPLNKWGVSFWARKCRVCCTYSSYLLVLHESDNKTREAQIGDNRSNIVTINSGLFEFWFLQYLFYYLDSRIVSLWFTLHLIPEVKRITSFLYHFFQFCPVEEMKIRIFSCISETISSNRMIFVI